MRRLWFLLLPLALIVVACERGTVRDTDDSGTGQAPGGSGDSPAADAGLPNTSPSPGAGGGAPAMQQDTNYNRTPRGAFVIEGTIRRDPAGVWTLETERQPFQLLDLPASYQRDGLRTKLRLEMVTNTANAEGRARQAARVIEIGDNL